MRILSFCKTKLLQLILGVLITCELSVLPAQSISLNTREVGATTSQGKIELLFRYEFDEGKGNTVKDIAGTGEPQVVTIRRMDAEQPASISLLDLSGRQMTGDLIMEGMEIQMDVSKVKSGTYLIRIQTVIKDTYKYLTIQSQ